MRFDALQIGREEVLIMEFVREVLEDHAHDVIRRWAYGPKVKLFQSFSYLADLRPDVFDGVHPGFEP